MQVKVQADFTPEPCKQNEFNTRLILQAAHNYAAEKKLMPLNDGDAG